jgi:hypothetical protein
MLLVLRVILVRQVIMIAIQRIRTALTRKIQKAKARQIPTKITIRVIKERSSGGSLKGIIKPALQLQ